MAKQMSIQEKAAQNRLKRREFLMTQSREEPLGLTTPQKRAWQRRMNMIPTPERAAFHAAQAGRPELDAEYYRSKMPPVAQLPAVTAQETMTQLRGTPTPREMEAAKQKEAEAQRYQERRVLGYTTQAQRELQGTQLGHEKSMAEIEAANKLNLQGNQLNLEREKLRAEQYLPERLIQTQAAQTAIYDAGRNRAIRSAGLTDLNDLLEPMYQVAKEGGSPGAFGFLGVQGDLSAANSVINAYNRLVSDPTYGPEMEAWFEAQPQFQQFKRKIQSWGMNLGETAPPVAEYSYPPVYSR